MKPSIARVRALVVTVLAGFTVAACTPQQIAWWNDPNVPQEHKDAVAAEMRKAKVCPFECEAMGEDLPDVSGHHFLVCVRRHESDTAGGYRAQNPRSSASGAYQYLRSTWVNVSARAGFPGYPPAAAAPPRGQDHVTLWLYNNGGRSAWAGTGC